MSRMVFRPTSAAVGQTDLALGGVCQIALESVISLWRSSIASIIQLGDHEYNEIPS